MSKRQLYYDNYNTYALSLNSLLNYTGSKKS